MPGRPFLSILFLLLLTAPVTAQNASPVCPDLSAAAARQRLEGLAAEIRHHDHLYYEELKPAISDAAYDRLFAELLGLERCFPEWAAADSPTRRVGGDAPAGTAKVRHAAPMRSLDSAADESRVVALLQRLAALGGGEVLLQPKVDGLPVELVYEQGRLVSAATRGDGEGGENVTERVRQLTGIPARLAGDYPERVVLRGEVYADLRLLAAAPPQIDYPTPRHLAAATLRAQTPDPQALAALRFFPFALVSTIPDAGFLFDRQALAQLQSWGLPVDPAQTRTASTLAEVRSFYQETLAGRDRQPFAMDGIVVKADAAVLRRRLGEGSRAPRWAAAWKFPPATALTRILRIDWQTGRTGRRTPVAEVTPVLLGGVRVSRLSLHSAAALERSGARPGDEVVIALAGDAVPQLLEVVGEATSGVKFSSPPLTEAGIADCLCDSPACRPQFLARASHFVSPAGLAIAGLGRGRLQKLIEAGLVHDLPGIFGLTEAAIAEVPGFGPRSARQLAQAIRQTARPQRARLLTAIGIPGVGPVAAGQLAAAFPAGAALFAASPEELMAGAQVGRRAAENFHAFFAAPEGLKLLRQLRDLGWLQ